MNLRQKAKHYKRLYEQTLPKSDLVKTHVMFPKYYRITQLIETRDINYLKDNPQMLKTHIENRILQELRPLLWNNLKTERDMYSDRYRYTLDIWLKN